MNIVQSLSELFNTNLGHGGVAGLADGGLARQQGRGQVLQLLGALGAGLLGAGQVGRVPAADADQGGGNLGKHGLFVILTARNLGLLLDPLALSDEVTRDIFGHLHGRDCRVHAGSFS